MSVSILSLEIHYEQDVVLARQRAREISAQLGFEVTEQARFATSVSEVTRNAFQYARGARVAFEIDTSGEPELFARVVDRGSGIPDLEAVLQGRHASKKGIGVGLAVSRRLMDRFEIESSPSGTRVVLGKKLPAGNGAPAPARLAQLMAGLALRAPRGAFEEIQQQNQELARTLEELRLRTKELEETNRAVLVLHSELENRAESLKMASRHKSEFLSHMSHELRTPLNAIRSLARLLLDRIDGDLTREQETQVNLIRRSAEDLTSDVNDLLDLAKVEAGKCDVCPEPLDVNRLLGALRAMFRPIVSSSDVTLVIEETSDLPLLETDEKKLSQILRNLISNALKFTERGEVRVSARVIEGGSISFTVTDTGIGIAAEDQERIFDQFTQLETRVRKAHKGTGLGLPLARRLARLLGGSLTVRSAPGAGATFTATISCTLARVPETQAAHD